MAYPTKQIKVRNPRGYRARRGARKGYSLVVRGEPKRKAKRKPQGAEPRFPTVSGGSSYAM